MSVQAKIDYEKMIQEDVLKVTQGKSFLHNAAAYHTGFLDEKFNKLESYPGKLSRPILALKFCECFGGKVSQVLPVATAIQIFHNFTLVHDDIEDNDSLRRGRPTVWSLWGVNQGINVGDFMYNLAIKSLTRVHKDNLTNVLDVLTEAFERVVEGQGMDLGFAEKSIKEISVNDYLKMIEGKSASLIEVSCSIGAYMAGEKRDEVKLASGYGLNLGLAYQVYDDYMGLWGNEAETGKKTASDIYEKKKSYPLLYAYERANSDDKMTLDSIYFKQKITKEDATKVLDIFERYDAREGVIGLISKYKEKTVLCLEKMDISSSWQVEFKSMINKLVKI